MDVDKENCSRDDDARIQFGSALFKLAESYSRAAGDRAPFTPLLANGLSRSSLDSKCASCDALRSRVTRAEARSGDTLEKLREARDENSELRRASEEATAVAERAKTMLNQQAQEEAALVEEEQNALKRAERRWCEEVRMLQTFCDDAQHHRAEARQQRDVAEEAAASAQQEIQELKHLRAIHQRSVEEHSSERFRWQEEVSSMAADFRDLRELAANAARLPARLRAVEEEAAEQCHRLRICEDDLCRLHAERRTGLEAEGELRVARLQAAQSSQEWCEASLRQERCLRAEEARAERLESRLVKLECELEIASCTSSTVPRTGSRRTRWHRSHLSILTSDGSSGADECGALSRHRFATTPNHRSSGGMSKDLDFSFGDGSGSACSISGEYDPFSLASQRSEALR
mmetsp:Transcript_90771/g.143453  ORF Transcript_90771/g.143453 Transcript_90771/m.143453 type:complete len:404 (+) Transcript_90771:42-1253(+)|eukprot:CAMPEP_0169404178 /NCGR_PEP_ID=MMETSP1017-20121227/56201_1 /TAXON_ID=342587 /ORGANISM="Karlodinium micrum, Strain CCMP2283" /LENGTH=403 /DNA_ID=CAMNT_0009510543 /DNA_START=39 /DNA_END=1250 /DNA_ORIENTATION=-